MAENDEQLRESVLRQLCWDERVDTTYIKVEVEDGKVTLIGTVPNFTTRRAAEQDAMRIPGVRSVDNHLQIDRHLHFPGAAEQDIRARIENTLLWSMGSSSNDIKVRFSSGVATLEGTVDSYWKKLRAEELASDIIGVVDIKNLLRVVPRQELGDRAIAAEIEMALERGLAIDAHSIRVRVDNGVVTLSGVVPTWTMYIAAEDTAHYTPGVREVRNNLSVE